MAILLIIIFRIGAYQRRLAKVEKCDQPLPLISIVVDIAYRNPRTYSTCAAILSKLLDFLGGNDNKRLVIEKIQKKFSQIPNTGHMEIWLQRISLPFAPDIEFSEPLCRLVSGKETEIWNSDWLSSDALKKALDATQIVDQKELQELDAIIPIEEVQLFTSDDWVS